MTSKDDDLVEKIAAALARFHCNACYPKAEPIELEYAARSIEALMRPIIEREALERAAKAVQPDPTYSASIMTADASAAIRALIPRDEEEKP
jgi:hypothetical protein